MSPVRGLFFVRGKIANHLRVALRSRHPNGAFPSFTIEYLGTAATLLAARRIRLFGLEVRDYARFFGFLVGGFAVCALPIFFSLASNAASSSSQPSILAASLNRSTWGSLGFFCAMTFIHPSKRYRLFFDETGNGDLHAAKKDPNQRYLSVTGVVIRQDIHDRYTTRRLARLKADIFGHAHQSTVLHRRELMSREGVFAALNDDHLRAQFDARFAALVAEVPAPAFTVSIDKQRHLEKYKVWQFSPYHYVMTCLLERFVLWLNRTGNVGDVMGEARNPTHDAQLRRAFRFFHKNGTKVRPAVIQARLLSKELRLEPKIANIAGLQIGDSLR